MNEYCTICGSFHELSTAGCPTTMRVISETTKMSIGEKDYEEQIRQEEREACKQICHNIAHHHRLKYTGFPPYETKDRGDPRDDAMCDGAYECADAIEKRSEK